VASGASLFELEWQAAGQEVRAPELAATWARLEVAVAGNYPTVVEDLENRSIRRSIFVPLFSLAEWIAYNWWGLLFGTGKEPHSDGARLGRSGNEAGGYNFRSVGDGFSWPNLSVVTDGGRSLLTWREEEPPHPGWPVRFLTSGTAWVDTDWLTRSLSQLVEATLTRLDEVGLTHTTLHKEWSVLKSLDDEEMAFCRACGRLGLDPFAEGHDFARAIEEVFERLDQLNADEFFEAVRPTGIGTGLDWVAKAEAVARKQTTAAAAPCAWPDMASLRQALGRGPSGYERPYETGYRQAAAVRKAMSLAPTAPLRPGDLPVVATDFVGSPDRSLQGLSLASAQRDRAGLVLGWLASPPSLLFASARSAWSLCFEDASDELLLTGASSVRQQVSRAFAAELLAPAEGIGELTDGAGTGAWPSLADHFGVSEMVIQHQIANRP
jgi:hypothetical protein